MTALRVLAVSHNASRSGAPRVLHNLISHLGTEDGAHVDVLLLAGGPMEAELASVARLVDAPAGPYDLVLCNTTESLAAAERWDLGGSKLVVWVHEPAWVLQHWVPKEALDRLPAADHVMCVSPEVEQAVHLLGMAAERTSVCPGFIDVAEVVAARGASPLRDYLGLAADAVVIGSVGTTDWRKGPDLAVAAHAQLRQRLPAADLHSVWLGGEPVGPEVDPVRRDVEHAGLGGRVHFVGEQTDGTAWMAGFDVLAMVSRADPFPLAVLEAAALEVPVVGFDTAGLGGLLEAGDPRLVRYPDLAGLVDQVAATVKEPAAAAEGAAALARRVRDRHDTSAGAPPVVAQLHAVAGR